ncbi:MAG TPA: cation diffusion facilitator family transporter [Gammaproteobacteria bacterium]|nr:cation diffusion facilitator family transporter [Gammaproteobacteria bacterium]
MHDHAHPPHTHPHHRFVPALLITLGFALIELLGGIWANSLALMGDAGHMLTDAVALGIAAAATWFAQRPASARHTFGFGRMEVVAALINTVCMFAILAGIGIEAVSRLLHPAQVNAPLVMLVALAGLVVNVIVYKVLERSTQSLNARAALLHVFGDMLGSLAALSAGIVIWFTGWMPIDPLLSLFIGVLILISSVRLLREAGHVLLEGVPAGLEIAEIGRSMAGISGVSSVHDLHIWSLSSSEISLSAHIVIEDMQNWQDIHARLQAHLRQRHHIGHTTLQPESTVLARVAVDSLRHRK